MLSLLGEDGIFILPSTRVKLGGKLLIHNDLDDTQTVYPFRIPIL